MKIKQKQNENDTIAAHNINLMPSKIYTGVAATKSTVNSISNRQMCKLELDRKHWHERTIFAEVRFLWFLCFRQSKNRFTLLCNFC